MYRDGDLLSTVEHTSLDIHVLNGKFKSKKIYNITIFIFNVECSIGTKHIQYRKHAMYKKNYIRAKKFNERNLLKKLKQIEKQAVE